MTRHVRPWVASALILSVVTAGCVTGPSIHGVVSQAAGGRLSSGEGTLAFSPFSFAVDGVFVEMHAVDTEVLRAALGSTVVGGIDFDIVADERLLTPAVAEFLLSRPQSCGARLHVYHRDSDGRFTLRGDAIVGNDAARATYTNITEDGLWVVLVGGG